MLVVMEGLVKPGPPVLVVTEGLVKPGPPLLRMNRYILVFFLVARVVWVSRKARGGEAGVAWVSSWIRQRPGAEGTWLWMR